VVGVRTREGEEKETGEGRGGAERVTGKWEGGAAGEGRKGEEGQGEGEGKGMREMSPPTVISKSRRL